MIMIMMDVVGMLQFCCLFYWVVRLVCCCYVNLPTCAIVVHSACVACMACCWPSHAQTYLHRQHHNQGTIVAASVWRGVAWQRRACSNGHGNGRSLP